MRQIQEAILVTGSVSCTCGIAVSWAGVGCFITIAAPITARRARSTVLRADGAVLLLATVPVAAGRTSTTVFCAIGAIFALATLAIATSLADSAVSFAVGAVLTFITSAIVVTVRRRSRGTNVSVPALEFTISRLYTREALCTFIICAAAASVAALSRISPWAYLSAPTHIVAGRISYTGRTFNTIWFLWIAGLSAIAVAGRRHLATDLGIPANIPAIRFLEARKPCHARVESRREIGCTSCVTASARWRWNVANIIAPAHASYAGSGD
jgi:hypothetical protein